MFRWLLYLIPSLLSTALCYLTNWAVVPFADKNGELPWPFHLWQTWDNSVFCSESVEYAPKFLQYDWPKHYCEYKDTTQLLRSWNRDRWFVECIDDNFTFVEKLKRYACGVLWLMRNNAYGFAFYLLGATVTPLLSIKTSKNTISVNEVNGDAWMYKNDAPIFSLFGYTLRWKNIIGWKIALGESYDTRAMIANRIAFSIKREE